MGYVEDRWFRTVKDEDGKKLRTPLPRHGQGKRYRVRYTDPEGAEKSKSFARKEDAERFRSTVEADVLRGNYIDPDAGRVTLRSYGTEWVAQQGGEATTREHVKRRCEKHIFPVLGRHTIGHLCQRPSLIQAWLTALDLSDVYKRAIFTHLSAMFEAAVADGLIPRNPCKAQSVKVPKLPKRKIVPWPAERVAAVRAQLPERYRPLADLGAGLGLRQGECFGLAVEDIDWLRNAVHVRRQVRLVRYKLVFSAPKGRREREVPLPESVKLRLSAHLAAFPAQAVTLPRDEPGGKPETRNLIVTTSVRSAMHRSYFDQSIWHPALDRAGVERIRENGFHALRHHYASVLLRGGEDVRTLAEYLGHHDPGFTLRVYGHFIPGGGDRTRRIIDDLFSGRETAQDRPKGAEGTGNAR